jgi:molybdenum cofactor cytidylyltransferase
MEGAKQLAMWTTAKGEKPLVAAAYDAVRPICDDMVVVLGHEADAVAAALGERAFHRAESDPDAPMFESIRTGLKAAQSLDAAATIVLQPGDHPEVAESTLVAITEWSLKRPVHAIIPQHAGAGGHPVLIPPAIAALLIETNCPEGLGEYWLAHPELCFRIAVDDASVLRDIDMPSDLAR